MKKYFFAILTSLALTQGVFGQKAEQKADTGTWKFYENNDYGFTFRYPQGSTITDFTKSSKRFLIQIPFTNGWGINSLQIQIQIEIFKKGDYFFVRADTSIFSANKIDFACRGGNNGVTVQEDYYVRHNGMIYMITTWIDYPGREAAMGPDGKTDVKNNNKIIQLLKFQFTNSQ